MSGFGSATPQILAGHFALLVATLLLLAVWIASGGWVLRRLRVDSRSWPAPLPLVTKALLGQGMLALVMLALGAIGQLRPGIVLGVVAVMMLLLRRDLAELATGLRAWRLPAKALPRVGLACWVLLGLIMVMLALAPPWEWDTLMYHLALPLEFLRSGAIRVPPDSFHIALIGPVQLSAIPLLAAGFPAGGAMASVACYFLLAGTLLGTARLLGEEDSGWWSLLLIVGAPAFLLVATTARIDVTVSGALLVAQTLLLLAIIRRQPAALVISAICFGIAGGMKLHALAYAAACAPVVLLGWKDRRTLALALGAFLLALGPWLLKNALLVGAPFYPLGAQPRLEPWLAAITGSAAIPSDFDTRSLSQLAESRVSFNVEDAFLHPEQLTIEGEGRFYGLPPWLLLLPVSLIVLRRRPQMLALMLPALGYLAIILIPFPETNLRYVFPAVPPLILGVASGVGTAFRRPLAPALGRGILLLVLGVQALILAPALKARIGWDVVLVRWAAGIIARERVRTALSDDAARQIVGLERALSALGRDAKVLLFWESRSAGLAPRTLSDLRLSNWPLLSQTAAATSCLARTGITHVVINSAALKYYLARGATQAEIFRTKELEQFENRCLTLAGSTSDYLIYRVRPIP